MSKKRYFIFFLIIAGILLCTTVIVSYIEDPGGAFTKNTYEKGVADILLSDHNVGNIENYDERILQKNIIQNDPRHIGIIVLGSSRSMQIQNSPAFGENFKDQTFINHAVSSATIQDYIAILELYFEKADPPPPHTIIIGVDPWILNANNGEKNWMTLKNEYISGVARINATVNISEQDSSYDFNYDLARYSSLLSRPVIIKSINKLVFGSYYATDLSESDVGIRLKDGTISYPSFLRDRTVRQVDSDAESAAQRVPILLLGNFTQLDKKSELQFESTIHYLKSRNVTIILFLPSYHPIVYNKIVTEPQYSQVKEAESYFKNLALAENIKVIGSYDPTLMNITSADFYDGWHMRREVVNNLFVAQGLLKRSS